MSVLPNTFSLWCQYYLIPFRFDVSCTELERNYLHVQVCRNVHCSVSWCWCLLSSGCLPTVSVSTDITCLKESQLSFLMSRLRLFTSLHQFPGNGLTLTDRAPCHSVIDWVGCVTSASGASVWGVHICVILYFSFEFTSGRQTCMPVKCTCIV